MEREVSNMEHPKQNELHETVRLAPGGNYLVCALGELSPAEDGCILELNLTLADVCPEKRTALAVTVSELDRDDREYPRGLRTLLIPAHHGEAPVDVYLDAVRFVLPGSLDVGGGDRRFVVRADCHYVDYHARCQLPAGE